MDTITIEQEIESITIEEEKPYVIGTVDGLESLLLGVKETTTVFIIDKDDILFYDEGEEYFDVESDNYIKTLDLSITNSLDLSSIEKIVKLNIEHSAILKKADELNSALYEVSVNPHIYTAFSKNKNKELYEALDAIIVITKKAHGDNFRYTVDALNKQFSIYLLYPEVTISNNNNVSRTIKDLVVKIVFGKVNNSYIVISTISGTRLTWGDTEAKCGYRHSHLSRIINRGAFSDFCLGATEIAAMNMDLRNIGKYSYSKYELFVHMIGNYLTHESLEGVPYIKMTDIMASGDRFTPATRLIDSLYTKQFSFNLNYDVSTCKFKVLIDDTLKKSIINNLKAENYIEASYMVIYKEGYEYRIDTMITPDLERSISYDVEVSNIAEQFNITPSLYDDNIKSTNSDYKLSQKIIEYVITILEKEINDYYNIKYATD